MRDPLDWLADNAQPLIIWFSVIIDFIWSIHTAQGFDVLAMFALAIPSMVIALIVLILLMVPAFIVSTVKGLLA